jgi:hypothetical protein
MGIVKISARETFDFRIGQPYKTGKGRPLYVSLRGETPQVIISKFRTPFGLDKYVSDDATSSSGAKYSVSVSLPEGLAEADAVRDFIADFERQCIDFVHDKQFEIFGEKEPKKREIIADRFTSAIGCSAGWEPRLKLKLNTDRNGAFTVAVYGPDKEEQHTENLQKNDHLGVLCELGPIWVVDKKFGLSLVAKQIRRWPGADTVSATRGCLIPDDDDEEEPPPLKRMHVATQAAEPEAEAEDLDGEAELEVDGGEAEHD